MVQSILFAKSFRPKTLLVFLYLSCGLSLSQCKKAVRPTDDNALKCVIEPVIGKENDIVGKWKLVKSYYPMMNKTEEYSCNNIVYSFRLDGSLQIIRDVLDDAKDMPEVHSYELIQEPYLNDVMALTLKIGHSEYGCSISKESMTLNSAPLDGAIQTFVRIK